MAWMLQLILSQQQFQHLPFGKMSVHVYLHCFGRQRFIKCISSAGIFQIQQIKCEVPYFLLIIYIDMFPVQSGGTFRFRPLKKYKLSPCSVLCSTNLSFQQFSLFEREGNQIPSSRMELLFQARNCTLPIQRNILCSKALNSQKHLLKSVLVSAQNQS